MSIYRINDTIAYDQDQGMFMLYLDQGLRKLPQHFVSRFESGENFIDVVCETKHHTETIRFECSDSPSVVEKLTIILEDF